MPLPFTDGFESGFGNWIKSGQDWDTTSFTFRAGGHSITDSRIGNYPSYGNESITMIGTMDLTGIEFPVLSFWHKYALNNNNGYNCYNIDYGYVELSTDGGWNWVVDTSFTGYQNTWSQQLVDLRGYRTDSVKVRFRLASGYTCESDGWYIDDVEIKEFNPGPTVPLPFTDGFESGFGNWIKSGQDWDTTSFTFRAGGHSITDSRIGNYPSYGNESITMIGTMDLTGIEFPVLSFWHKYALNNNNGYNCYNIDYGYVELSTDGGWNWVMDTSFTGYLSAWAEVLVDLRGYRTDSVKVRFRLVSGGICEDDGWYIDDVNIFGIGVTTFQLSVSVTDGWNTVCIPGLNTTNQNVNTWWQHRDMSANVFKYAGGYHSVTAATPGTGYWMKHAGARTYNTGDEWPAGGIQTVAHNPITAAQDGICLADMN